MRQRPSSAEAEVCSAFCPALGQTASVPARKLGFVVQMLWLIAWRFLALLKIFRLSPILVSARHHDALLMHHRKLFVFERLGMAAIFLGLAAIAWIPIDYALFNGDWRIVAPLVVGRLAAAMLFFMIAFMIAGLKVRCNAMHCMLGSSGLVIAVACGFFFFAHGLIAHMGNEHQTGPGHLQYLFMPIAMAAGIAIFPLTLVEAALLSAGPLLALIVEMMHGDGNLALREAGAVVLLMGAVMATATVGALSQLKLLIDLHRRSKADPLTGALSRRAGGELLDLLFAESRFRQTPLAFLFLDLDRFKAINDQFGHEAGDRVLRQVALRFNGLAREMALIRWGGEEFVLVLPGVEAATAAAIATELGRSLGNRPDGRRQTVSIGLAERIRDQARSWQELVKLADERMYAAKDAGRDCLIGPDGPSNPVLMSRSDVTATPVAA